MPAIRLLTGAELVTRPPPTFLVDGVIPAGAAAALVGAPGHGKTFLALDLALSIAAGTAWHDCAVQRGGVVYIATEDVHGLGQRAKAWCRAHGGDAALTGLAVHDGAVQVHVPQEVALFVALARPLHPAFVVIDTLARCFVGGDENSAQDMGRYVAGVDAIRAQLGVAVLSNHHVGHKKGRERGSTALRGAVDTLLLIQRRSDGVFALSCEKQRGAAPFDPFALRLGEVDIGDEETSCVFEDVALSVGELPAAYLTSFDRLAAFAQGASYGEWRRATKVPETTFRRHRRDLIAAGAVVQRGEKYYIVAPATKTV